MIAYYERYNGISNFRVRMAAIEMVEEDRIMCEDTKDFNVADYSKEFRMFSGETEQLNFSLIIRFNVVIDRFERILSSIDKMMIIYNNS